MMLCLSTEYEVHALSCLKDGGYVVFNKITGRIFRLNESAYWILRRFSEPSHPEAVLQDFKDRYLDKVDSMEQDFYDLIHIYLSNGILSAL